MKIVKCSIHNVEFQLPTTEEEYLSGELHNETIRIQTHSEDNHQCKMKVKNIKI